MNTETTTRTRNSLNFHLETETPLLELRGILSETETTRNLFTALFANLEALKDRFTDTNFHEFETNLTHSRESFNHICNLLRLENQDENTISGEGDE
jgi:hypothetical protein